MSAESTEPVRPAGDGHDLDFYAHLRTFAVARLFLDNIPHLKAYWVMLGVPLAQEALDWGVDDLDGTVDDSTKIYSMAGAEEKSPTLSSDRIRQIITEKGRVPTERDSWYRPIPKV